ncbi:MULTISPECIES: hypothetical protein [unclassified Bacillus (in: firmicutes)]|uniref:hypothetical protein n=1 Tax=unclassified Bacillus (in: firmicutes) TaxID=185979 RepID=UPI0008DF6869|nr:MULTISPECIES: hypothetical protein [unclassified Bacillus (in: firmicutes)]SFA78245.1 hypothetical protein SAMN02799634_101738 [Bacillus sp. UNCCL13]SFQ68185.1 hypothetical protein SAMN04488577_1013 [Bacillus sp. cl95]
MGYIIPVTQYQYMQYHNREIGTTTVPLHTYKIERVRVVNGEEPTQDHESSSQERLQTAPLRARSPYKKMLNERLIEKVYSEITGKGNLYSKSV